jgi:signal transduction histidine kinase
VRDITCEKRTLVALEQARVAAEDTARMKTMFLANMSHEIRTPMSAIIGLLSLVLNKPLSAELRDYLEKIKTSADSLLTILNDILDYSKVESGHMEIDPHPFDVHEMVQNLHNLFAIRAEDKDLKLVMTVNSLVPKIVIGDSLRIQQILTNLIGNAIKFTAKGNVALTISRVMRQDAQIKLRFQVEDSGIGMTENDKTKLFQAFSQVDNSITRRFGGTGLGLVISGNLLELMHSQFQVESVVGRGSVFSFELMLTLPTLQECELFEQQQQQRQASAQSQIASNQLLAGTAILVVEDNSLNQQVAREFLELLALKLKLPKMVKMLWCGWKTRLSRRC